MKTIKWLIVLAIIMFTSCTAEVTPDFITVYHKTKLVQLSADTNRYDVVFMGDSITDGGAFESVLQNTKNAGISGDWITHTEDVIPYVRQYTPNKIYLMIGVNSLSKFTYDECVRQYRELIDMMLQAFPNTEIVLESVLPIATDAPVIPLFNSFIRGLAEDKGLRYLDLYSLYAVEGKLPEEITPDGLHLTAEGYAKWYEVLRAENAVR